MGNRPSSAPGTSTRATPLKLTVTSSAKQNFRSLPNSTASTPQYTHSTISIGVEKTQYTYNSPKLTTNSISTQWHEQHQYQNNRSLICYFCNGKQCKHENYLLQIDRIPAITGLNSTWINSNILAMQRPSTRLNQQFNIPTQFQQHNIHCIINLQLSGEHSLCGDGIGVNGFSYGVDEYSAYNISVYHYGFEDMSVPSVQYMHDICKIIAYHITVKQQNVAVHCHAGYGRTGLVIACALMYMYSTLTAQLAIDTVRTQRKQCIQTSKQQQFVHDFYIYLQYLRCIYKLDTQSNKVYCTTYRQLLERQTVYLHGTLQQQYKHKHQLIELLCNRLTNELNKPHNLNTVLNALVNGYCHTKHDTTNNRLQSHTLMQLIHPDYSPYIQYDNAATYRTMTAQQPKLTVHNETQLTTYKQQINTYDCSCIQNENTDIQYVVMLLYDLFEQFTVPLIQLDCNTLHTNVDIKHVFNKQIQRIHIDTLNLIMSVLHSILQSALQIEQHCNLTLLYRTVLRFGCMLCLKHQTHEQLNTVTVPYSCAIRTAHTSNKHKVCNSTYSIKQYNSLVSCMIELCTQWNTLYTTLIKHEQQQHSTKAGILNIKFKLSNLVKIRKKPKLTNNDIESSIASVNNQWSAISSHLTKTTVPDTVASNDTVQPNVILTPATSTIVDKSIVTETKQLEPKSLFTQSPMTDMSPNKHLTLKLSHDSMDEQSSQSIISPPFLLIHNTPLPSAANIPNTTTTNNVFNFQNVTTDTNNARRTPKIRVSPQPSQYVSKIPVIQHMANKSDVSPNTTIVVKNSRITVG